MLSQPSLFILLDEFAVQWQQVNNEGGGRPAYCDGIYELARTMCDATEAHPGDNDSCIMLSLVVYNYKELLHAIWLVSRGRPILKIISLNILANTFNLRGASLLLLRAKEGTLEVFFFS